MNNERPKERANEKPVERPLVTGLDLMKPPNLKSNLNSKPRQTLPKKTLKLGPKPGPEATAPNEASENPLALEHERRAAVAFDTLDLSPSLLTVVKELGFTSLTPVQAQCIPHLLAGRDLIGQSKTGSGKTAAFALPILEKIDLSVRDVQALILCPTRELCTQVARDLRRLGSKHNGLQVLVVCGGQPSRPQSEALKKGVHLIVGTPGRVLDHITRGRLFLGAIQTLVLDEADRMLDMGFEDDMKIIMDEVPGTRQTVFFSATYPASIQSLSRNYQHSPVMVKIADSPETSPLIEQFVFQVEREEKMATLLKLLRHFQPESAIIFCNQKISVAELALKLEAEGVSAGALHGDLEQRDRDRVMAKFRNASTRILVATDVAARGLDIQGLHMVFNYDLPHQAETYIHRIGRTGRAGKEGIAVSLASPREGLRVHDIEKATGRRIAQRSLQSLKMAPPTKDALKRDAEMQTLYISGGRKDKLRPGDILGALTGEAGGLRAEHIGKIEIHDKFSYVAVAKSIAETALERLRDGRIKGSKFQIKFVK